VKDGVLREGGAGGEGAGWGGEQRAGGGRRRAAMCISHPLAAAMLGPGPSATIKWPNYALSKRR